MTLERCKGKDVPPGKGRVPRSQLALGSTNSGPPCSYAGLSPLFSELETWPKKVKNKHAVSRGDSQGGGTDPQENGNLKNKGREEQEHHKQRANNGKG